VARALIFEPADELSVVTIGADADATEACRVLIALKAMIPATATIWRTRTMSNARDNFMLVPTFLRVHRADAPKERRAVAAGVSFSCVGEVRQFGHFDFHLRRACTRAEIDHRDRRSF